MLKCTPLALMSSVESLHVGDGEPNSAFAAGFRSEVGCSDEGGFACHELTPAGSGNRTGPPYDLLPFSDSQKVSYSKPAGWSRIPERQFSPVGISTAPAGDQKSTTNPPLCALGAH